MSHKITESNVKLFTKTLFERYVKECGNSLSKLDDYTFIPMFCNFPSEFYEVNGNVIKPLLVEYTRELESLGYVVKTEGVGLQYKITPEGYFEGYRLKHPIKHFHKKNWKWLYGTVVIGIIMALATLTAPKITDLLEKDTGNKVHTEKTLPLDS